MGQKRMGLEEEALIRAVGAFGGGIASTGRVCGAMLGGVALISRLLSRGNLQERDAPEMWRYCYRFARRFEALTQEFGSVECRDIARVNWSDRDEVRRFYNDSDSRRHLCIRLVGETAHALGEILDGLEVRGTFGMNKSIS